MAAKKPLKFDGNKRRQFLTWLTKLGYIGPAAAKCKIGRSTIYEHRDGDPQFKEAIDHAISDHLDHWAAEYADQAINGVDVERSVVIDQKVTKVKERIRRPYLLARYVEKRHPDFKPALEVTFPEGGGVLAIRGTIPVDQWLTENPNAEEELPVKTGTHTTPVRRS
jgi:hypothetical protein